MVLGDTLVSQICQARGPDNDLGANDPRAPVSHEPCYLINQLNVSAITIYPRLFGTRLIGKRPTETRLIGTVKIDRVQLERVSLACNRRLSPSRFHGADIQ